MAKNIYDLFNERKNGIDCLVEGLDPTEFADIEAFEDLDKAVEALETITMESTNEMVEFQAAMYLEDLVLENMMYDDFDEEKIQNVMEAAKEEKKEGLVQKIKNLWQKIKEWFAKLFKTIVNHFQSGETLVAKYRKEIPQAMHQSKAKINMRPFKDPDGAINAVNGIVAGIKLSGAQSKEQVLSTAGVSDKKGVQARVEELFYEGDKKVEKKLSEMKVEPVMKWAGNKKLIIDGLKKQQKETDAEFKSILSEIQQGDNKNKNEQAANFQFGISVVNSLINAEISCVKNISNVCTAIIRKAVSGKYDAKGPDKATAANTKDREDELKFNEKASKAGYGAKAANAMSRKKLNEEWEIIDEEENNDDVEW